MKTIKGTFGELLLNADQYVVVEERADGSKLCTTGVVNLPAAKKPATCSARVGERGFTYSGRPCSNKAVAWATEKQYAKTVDSRYGQVIYRFVIGPTGFVVGEPEPVQVDATVGFCKTHDPAAIKARQDKRDQEAREQRQRENARHVLEQKQKNLDAAKLYNYSFVASAAMELINTLDESKLNAVEAKALAVLRDRLAQLPIYVAVGAASYGFSSYMVDPKTGEVRPEYLAKMNAPKK